MSRKKLERFEQLKTFSNVVHWEEPYPKRKIKKIFRKYDKRILELACGKGEYTIGLAKLNEDVKNLYMGIDIQGERIWTGAKYALENQLSNICFLRTQIDILDKYIPRRSVDEIWITFPDPFLKERYERKRLTSEKFLKIYKKILKKNGVIHLKTDSKELYNFTLQSIEEFGGEILEKIWDIYAQEEVREVFKIKTAFEKRHLVNGKKIGYLQFRIC